MPNQGIGALSVVCLSAAVLILLFPELVKRLNDTLNRTVTFLDQLLFRHRRLFGWALFLASYLFFRLSLTLPSLRP